MSRLLSVDPGAERCGWAILEDGPRLLDSGILYCKRGNDEDFQHYRLRVETQAFNFFEVTIDMAEVDEVVNEIIPAAGGGNFVVAGQSYLANCVCTALHLAALQHEVPVTQISARTVQSRVAKRADTKKISKAQVRNGVIEIMPEVGQELTEHLLEWDRWDAIAIGLTKMGYKL